MTAWDDMDHEMQLLPLDGETADRMLAGRVALEDAPPGYAAVVRLLDAASTMAGPDNRERERELVVVFAHAVGSPAPRETAPRPSLPSRARLVAATVAAALGATTALASTGSLPDPVQNIASSILDKLGISVPAPSDRAGAYPHHRDNSAPFAGGASAPGERSEVSRLAAWAPTTGFDKDADRPTTETEVDEDADHPAAESGPHEAGSSSSEEPSSGSPGELLPAPTVPPAAGGGNGAPAQATDTEASGPPNGAVVSTQASGGKSQTGPQGPPPGGPGNGRTQATGRGAQRDAAEDLQGRPPSTNPGGRPPTGGHSGPPGPSPANPASGGQGPTGPSNTDPHKPGSGPPGTNPGGGPPTGGHSGPPGPSPANASNAEHTAEGSPDPDPRKSGPP